MPRPPNIGVALQFPRHVAAAAMRSMPIAPVSAMYKSALIKVRLRTGPPPEAALPTDSTVCVAGLPAGLVMRLMSPLRLKQIYSLPSGPIEADVGWFAAKPAFGANTMEESMVEVIAFIVRRHTPVTPVWSVM